MDKTEFVEALNEVLDQRRGEDMAHKEHHAFVSIMIDRERRRVERIESIKKNVFGWIIILLITGVGKAVWEFFKSSAQP